MKKGFIQTPLLLLIVSSVVLASIGGFWAYKEIQYRQVSQMQKEKQNQELTKFQQESLEKALQEIELLKQRQAEQENNPPQVLDKEINISSTDLGPYLTGVQSVSCYDSMGSGSLWMLNQTPLILTNKHVVKSGDCEMDFENKDKKTIGFYRLNTSDMYSINQETDSVLVPIKIDNNINPYVKSSPLSTLNYKISSLRKCQIKMPVGSPVVLIGYPLYGRKIVDDNGGWVGYRITTDGIISGYDDFLSGKYSNYFVSAKIDSGNSGGIAFSKDSSGLCVLGIPTWLTVGNYETQAIVQNIYNIFYKE